MASFSNSAEAALAALIYNATAWANIADNTATSPLANIWVALYTADPGEAGSATTNEATYTNYARVAVARTSGGWTVSGSDPTQIVNAGVITFPTCGITGNTVTHWGTVSTTSGAGVLYNSGPIGPVAGPYTEFTATSASPGVFTVPGVTFSVNDQVGLYHTADGTLPTGVTEGTIYYIGTAGAGTCTLSTTLANANPVNTSSTGAGIMIKATPLIVNLNIAPSFAASQLKILID